MRIVSWNCNGAFRKKYNAIRDLDADINVIQECEDPSEISDAEYCEFASNYIWCGQNKSKGLGVFAKQGINISENHWPKYCLREFLSVRVNDAFDLVAVLACMPYIKEYYVYQNINLKNYSENTILIGDFNSNSIWDKKAEIRTHSRVVAELSEIGLQSVYHFFSQEPQGKETHPTFYLQRNPNRKFHIDHCFADCKRVDAYRVLTDTEKWLKYSDHMPIVLEIK